MDVLSWKTVKTRKPHRCFGCGKEYPYGSIMLYGTFADNGFIYKNYWCNICNEWCERHDKPLEAHRCEDVLFEDPDGWNDIKSRFYREGNFE